MDYRTIACYIRYVRTIGERYKVKVQYWLTFNKMNCLELSTWSAAQIATTKPQDIALISNRQFIASAKAVWILHEIDKHNRGGNMLAFTVFYPHTCHLDDVLKTWKKMNESYFYCNVQSWGYYPAYKLKEYERNHIVLHLNEEEKECLRNGIVDFISFSYYMSGTVSANPKVVANLGGNLFTGVMNTYLKSSDWRWQIDLTVLIIALYFLYERYQKTSTIVENGLGAIDKVEKIKAFMTIIELIT